MTLRRILCLGALASSFMLAAGTSSQAAYSYSTAVTITGVTGSLAGANGTVTTTATGSTLTGLLTAAGVTAILGNFSSTPLIGASTGAIATVQVLTSNSTPQTFGVLYTDVITVTNPTPGGSTGTFTINGTLSLSGVFSLGVSAGTATNLYNGTFTQVKAIGPNIFTVTFGDGSVNDFFGFPGVNASSPGSLSANINGTTTIPEPTSLAILGTGLVGVVGFGLRRRMRSDSKRS